MATAVYTPTLRKLSKLIKTIDALLLEGIEDSDEEDKAKKNRRVRQRATRNYKIVQRPKCESIEHVS